MCSQRPRLRSSSRQVNDRRCVVYREPNAHDATEVRTSQWDTARFTSCTRLQHELQTQRRTSVRIDNGLTPEPWVSPTVIRRSIGRKPRDLGSKPHVQVIPVQSPEGSG